MSRPSASSVDVILATTIGSPISKRTLELQGGPMTAAQADTFEALPFAMDAVSVRQWDDQGKRAAVETPPLAHFLAIAKRCIVTP